MLTAGSQWGRCEHRELRWWKYKKENKMLTAGWPASVREAE
jgi:hypothetical protein